MSRFALVLAASISLVGIGADHPGTAADESKNATLEPSDVTLVAFIDEDCEPCERMRPVLRSLEQSGYQVESLNVKLNHYVPDHFKISAIPTFVAFDKDGEIWRHYGATSEEVMREALAKARKTPQRPNHPATVADKPNRIELLAFMADWCEPCQNIRPSLKALERSGYPLEIIDVDQSRHLASKYDVTALPTVIAVDENGERWRHVGMAREEELRKQLAKLPRKPDVPDSPTKVRDQANNDYDAGLPENIKVEHLLRVTYQLPKQRAKALLDFAEEHSELDFDAIIKENELILTASPAVHEALAPFINTVLQNKKGK